jgi:hypothetical protein
VSAWVTRRVPSSQTVARSDQAPGGTPSPPETHQGTALDKRFTTSLHPRSICIGETGFLGPETNRPKLHSGQKRSPRRPKRSRKSPPIAGSLPSPGNLQVRKIANQTVMSAPLVPRIVSRSHCSPRSGNAPPRFLHFSRLKVRPAARGQQPSQNSVYWRKVGDAGRTRLHFGAKVLKSLALPRGLEPLFSP